MATMRITTGMAMNTYRYNLQNSTYNLTNARNRVLTHRQFDSFAQDPTAAAQAWKIRRAMVSNANYQSNNSDTYSRFNIAWATMGMVKTNLETDADAADIRARQDTTAGARVDLGKVLNDTADSVIQAMNSAKFGDHFVFSGDDEMNAPFSWSADKKTLYYRGVDVNSGRVTPPDQEPDWGEWDGAAGMPQKTPVEGRNAVEDAWIAFYKYQNYVKASPEEQAEMEEPPYAPDPRDYKDPFGEVDQDEYGVPAAVYAYNKDPNNLPDGADPDAARLWATYYNDQGNKARLDKMAAEYENIDLGMGMKENENDQLINGTAFDRSLPAINMLGYGVDEDGDPVNIAMIMKRLGEIYSACDPTTGAFSEDGEAAKKLEAEADRLLNKYQAATDRTNANYVDVETKAHYLQQNQSRLKLQGDYLQEERENIENVDLADAITEFSWDYYCYSAALKVGTQLLSQSLIDYMS
ncbi:MAG: hypothetical protein HDT16_02485 [Oscillibacter sp.]|nr:hypothetical protein [Oscillibacter sp.]